MISFAAGLTAAEYLATTYEETSLNGLTVGSSNLYNKWETGTLVTSPLDIGRSDNMIPYRNFVPDSVVESIGG